MQALTLGSFVHVVHPEIAQLIRDRCHSPLVTGQLLVNTLDYFDQFMSSELGDIR